MRTQKPPIEFGQLCAIVRECRDPSLAEWAEAVKCRIVALGFAYPAPEQLSRAIAAIEKAYPERLAPPAHVEADPAPEARPLSREESIAALQRIQRQLGITLPARPMPRDTGGQLTTRQRYALVYALERVRDVARARKAGRGTN